MWHGDPAVKGYEFKASLDYIESSLGYIGKSHRKKEEEEEKKTQSFANLLALPWLVTKSMLVITAWQTDCCKQINI